MASPEELSLLFSLSPYRLLSSFACDVAPVRRLRPQEAGWHRAHESHHSQREAMLVLTGHTRQALEGRFYECLPGTLFLVDHDERHDCGYSPSSEGVHVWLYVLEGAVICNLFRCGGQRSELERRHVFGERALVERLNQAWNRAVHGAPEGMAETTALLRVVFCELSRVFLADVPAPPADMMESIRAHIREKCGRGCSIAALAQLAGCSRQHFMRSFKGAFGCTVGEMLQVVRREKYIELRGSLPLKQLADRLGFGSSAALCHWLRNNR